MAGADQVHFAVIENRETQRVVGYVRQRDVLLAYNRALLRARDEAHGEA